MRRLLFFVVLILLVGFFTFTIAREKVKKDFARPIPYPTTTVSPSLQVQDKTNSPSVESLFVPYWTVKDSSTGSAANAEQKIYDSYIYFGVTPGKDGIDMKESGVMALDTFASFVPEGKEKSLAVRMIDRDANFAILKDSARQKKLIAESILLAKEKKFNGLVLDLEISAIPFDSLIKQVNDFTALFYTEAEKNNLSFSLALYGDVFYRLRPFDVKALAKNADEIMVMAYDFSKAKGNPGPNFPLEGEETYGYDYKKMTEDFLKVVPAHKLTVIFGLFGYDWVVDGQGNTLQQGKALSSQEITGKFIESCQQRSCSFSREPKSFETQINYVARDGGKHIVWFEDMDSVEAKKAYLKSRGINSFSYWAYSYF